MSVLTSSTRFFCASRWRASLPAAVVLPAPLQAGKQDHRGWRMAQVERLRIAAHEQHEFVVDHPDQRLARREAALHFGADGLGLHGIDEALDHRQRDVGFQQRHAHFAQRLGDVFFGQAAAAAQGIIGLREAFSELGKHGARLYRWSAEYLAQRVFDTRHAAHFDALHRSARQVGLGHEGALETELGRLADALLTEGHGAAPRR